MSKSYKNIPVDESTFRDLFDMKAHDDTWNGVVRRLMDEGPPRAGDRRDDADDPRVRR